MPVFTELWMDDYRQARLRETIAAVSATDGAIIEVGCWEGRSTTIIANEFAPAPVHCIDHWLGDLTDPASPVASLAKQRDVYATFRSNMDELTAGNYIVHRGDWRTELKDWTEPVRYLFIDAQHTYYEVFDNIQWAIPLMVPGGVIAGDDSDRKPVWSAVLDSFGAMPWPGPVWFKSF